MNIIAKAAHQLHYLKGDKPAECTVSANISLDDEQLYLAYHVDANPSFIAAINQAGPRRDAKRCHELWRHTCFECFIALPNSTVYWEFNLSLGGEWNLYRFADYRQGMTEEGGVSALSSFTKKQDHADRCIDISAAFALPLPLRQVVSTQKEAVLAYNLTCILDTKAHALSFWALKPLQGQPDFHQVQGFTLLPLNCASND